MNDVISKISDSELEVMRVLWEAGDALSVTEIRARVQAATGWESSTIKTLVQRLLKKGAVSQEKREVFYYEPLVTKAEYSGAATRSLIDRLYHGSARNLVAALVGSGLSENDVAELRGLLYKEDRK